MNRYAAQGITNDARDEGKRIAVLTDGARAARDAFNEITLHAAGALRIHRTNGAQRIDYPSGGVITIHPNPNHLRGTTADIVYLNGEAERQVHDQDQWDTLSAALTTSTHPEIIRA